MKAGWLAIGLWCVANNAMGQAFPDSIKVLLQQEPKDSAYIVRLNKVAFSYLRTDPEAARALANLSMNFARQIGFTRGYSRALSVTGSSYWSEGNYESALDYYQLAARESGAVNDTTGLYEAYNNIGEVHKKLGDYPKAVEFLDKALSLQPKASTNYDLTLYNLGEAYYFMGRYSLAFDFFNQALSKAVAENDAHTLAYAYTGLGMLKAKDKEYFQALAYYTKAEAIWKELGQQRTLIQTYQDFADVYVSVGDLGQADRYLQQAVALATDIHAADLQMKNFQLLANLRQRQRQFESALAFINQYNTIRDSLYNEKRSQQIARLQTLFETEARDIENQQLKATQALLDAQIRTQQLLLATISAALVLMAFLAFIFFRQRKRIMQGNMLLQQKNVEIHTQKEAIERQSRELQSLNQQLQDLNRSLESKIEERTHQLTLKNEKLEKYAHANAHLLRAPVVSILGLLNLIERLSLSEADRTLVEHLQKCGRDLDRITREMGRALED
jgi:tetratricopeptide (TPR) repeat protein